MHIVCFAASSKNEQKIYFNDRTKAKQTLRKITETKSVCVYLCVCVCVPGPRKRFLEVIKFGTVTASENASHVKYIDLDLRSRYAKCLIISESFQAMPITFAVKIVRIKIYVICS